MDRGIQDIVAERQRQIHEEGWNEEHDEKNSPEDLAAAAACYLLFGKDPSGPRNAPPFWPWDGRWWKPKDFRRDLVRAGALSAAAIDRHDRVVSESQRSGQVESVTKTPQ